MTVQRFGTSSATCPNGLYVRHSDYAALEAECERLRAALRAIGAIENKMVGGDWDEIEEARTIARKELGEQA